jgi:hypothetical protein
MVELKITVCGLERALSRKFASRAGFLSYSHYFARNVGNKKVNRGKKRASNA